MRPTPERALVRRALLFSLLGGCFTSLVSLAVTAACAWSGLFSWASITDVIRFLPVIFVVSCALLMRGIIVYEGGWRIYKVVDSVKRNRVVGPGGWFTSIRWPGSTTHLFDPAQGTMMAFSDSLTPCAGWRRALALRLDGTQTRRSMLRRVESFR